MPQELPAPTGPFEWIPVETGIEWEVNLAHLEVEIVDMDGNPLPNTPFLVLLPDGTKWAEGKSDEEGKAKVLVASKETEYQVTLVDMDQTAWERDQGGGGTA